MLRAKVLQENKDKDAQGTLWNKRFVWDVKTVRKKNVLTRRVEKEQT